MHRGHTNFAFSGGCYRICGPGWFSTMSARTSELLACLQRRLLAQRERYLLSKQIPKMQGASRMHILRNKLNQITLVQNAVWSSAARLRCRHIRMVTCRFLLQGHQFPYQHEEKLIDVSNSGTETAISPFVDKRHETERCVAELT